MSIIETAYKHSPRTDSQWGRIHMAQLLIILWQLKLIKGSQLPHDTVTWQLVLECGYTEHLKDIWQDYRYAVISRP